MATIPIFTEFLYEDNNAYVDCNEIKPAMKNFEYKCVARCPDLTGYIESNN